MNKYLIVFLSFLMVLILCGTASAANFNGITPSNHDVVKITAYKDLEVTSLSIPATGVKGNHVVVPNTVKNIGNIASSGFYVRYYLKSSHVYYIGQRYIGGLAAMRSNSQNTVLTIPSSIPIGSYFILAKADGTNSVKEINEANNYRRSSSMIRVQDPLADLKVKAYISSDREEYSYNVYNLGTKTAPASKVHLLVYHTQYIYGLGYMDLVRDLICYIPQLAPRGSYSSSWTWIVDATIHKLVAQADPDNLIKESNENNNGYQTSSTV